ncbi:MAG: LysM peptidoglycan-binding domain-containing protein [Coriobacteriia bacterium]
MNAHSLSIGINGAPGRTRSARLSAVEVAAVALAAVALIACALISTGRPTTPAVKSITVRVSESDTLWEIARDHPVSGLSTAQTVAFIRDLNDMSTSAIVAGETLRVPADATAATAMARR